jgi:hypothetical protein
VRCCSPPHDGTVPRNGTALDWVRVVKFSQKLAWPACHSTLSDYETQKIRFEQPARAAQFLLEIDATGTVATSRPVRATYLYSDMTPDEFLQELYDEFKRTAEWPLLRDVQLRHFDTNLRYLAKTIGTERVVCNDGPSGSLCFLQLKEIANRSGSDSDQKNFVDAIRIIAQAYIAHGHERVELQHIMAELKLSQRDAKKLAEMLWLAGDISNAYGARGTLEFYLQPIERMLWFKDVSSMDEYFAIHDRINQEEAEGRHLDAQSWGTLFRPAAQEAALEAPNAQYHLKFQELDKVYSDDRAELSRTLDVEAWKSAAVLAGCCLEALLLDIWEANAVEAEREFGVSWRENTTAHRLALVAVRTGYLTEDQGRLADLLRRWRNVIHPVAAMRETAPTKELAHLLVAALNYLVAELRGRTNL